ncbi:MAG: zinc/manganese transport system ATP-binding protein [Mycobacterium sp.]|jgi:zinc/manganese transport system ATP-binding protein|nr:transporter ATP-binding protein [Mycobacterium sp.]MDT5135654.1 zinc/manganese transport system ATP-binding protein [Mycobacterium sp.]
MMGESMSSAGPTVRLRKASLAFGGHALWQNLDLTVAPGELVAVLGPNGSGKTSLVKVLLGLTPLSSGSVEVCGAPPKRGSNVIGYIPQQKAFERDLPIRGIDLVRLGLDGHRWGLALPNPRRQRLVDDVIASVGATEFAQAPIGQLSGGEQQRLRIAQALLGDPKLLLCDEALLSLDIKHQRDVVGLIDSRRRASNISVLFVTHEINPILPVVDRAVYVVGTRWAIGTPDEVFTSATLSELYQTDVEVLRVRGRIVVVGVPDSPHAEVGSADYHHLHGDNAVAR